MWDKHLRTWEAGSGKVISDRTLEPADLLIDANLSSSSRAKDFRSGILARTDTAG